MTIFASKSSKGFYDDVIHTPEQIPADAVAITIEQHQNLLDHQSKGCVLDWDTSDGIPVPVPPRELTLQERQDRAWEKIKHMRDTLNQEGGCKAAGEWFHTDTFSRSQHLGMVIMGENMPVGINWKTMDGTFVVMTPALSREIFASGAAQDQRTFTAAERHNIEMLKLENPEEYDCSEGWPETYQTRVIEGDDEDEEELPPQDGDGEELPNPEYRDPEETPAEDE